MPANVESSWVVGDLEVEVPRAPIVSDLEEEGGLDDLDDLDEDELDDDDLDDDEDDDLIDLDDEYDDTDEEERPHPGRFEE